MFTMIAPGEFRSERAIHGAPTNGTVGIHHASSMMSSAAPSFSPAMMPSPVLAFAPTVHSVVIGARWYFTRICSFCSKPPDPRITPRRARMSSGSADLGRVGITNVDSAHDAVLDVQVGERGVEPDRHPGLLQADPQRRDQRATHADEVLAGRLGPHGARPDLQAAQHTPRMPLELVQPHVILLHHNDIERNLAVRRLQSGQVRAELLGVERLRLDGAPARPAAGRLRVVVGVAGNPAHLQRGVLQHEGQHLGAAVEVSVDALGFDDVADDAVQVRPGRLRGIGDAVAFENLVVRDPHATARPRGRSTVVRGLLDDYC